MNRKPGIRSIIIHLDKDGDAEEAGRMAEKLQAVLTVDPAWQEKLPHMPGKYKYRTLTEIRPDAEHLILRFHPGGLSLMGDGLEMQGDLSHMIPRLKKNNLSGEFLVKASRLKNPGEDPVAIDATAGMGEDSLLLAAAGYRVYLYEINPVIAALLRDSLQRASLVSELKEPVSRMHVREGNSIGALSGPDWKTHPPDLVLLDPMFPERKKSGLIKKKFQLLQKLERPCSDEEELLMAAWQAKPRRIVVKRPLKGPYLAGRKPDYSMPGKAIRYDCYIL